MNSSDTLNFNLARTNPLVVRQGLLQDKLKKMSTSIDSDLIDQFQDRMVDEHRINLPTKDFKRYSKARDMAYKGVFEDDE